MTFEIVEPATGGGSRAPESDHAGQLIDSEHIITNGELQRLSTKQKREAVAKLLRAHPERSNRWIGEAIGVCHKTVATYRAGNRAAAKIPQLTKTIGRDGKLRAASASTARDIALKQFEEQLLALRRRIRRGDWSSTTLIEHNRLIERCRPHYPNIPSNARRNACRLGQRVAA